MVPPMALTLLLAMLVPLAVAAQESPLRRTMEIDGLVGYSTVDPQWWAPIVPNSSDKRTYGLSARAFLVTISHVQAGIEVATRHHFSDDRALPGVHFGIDRKVPRVGRFTIPLGIRLEYIPELYTQIFTIAIRSGVSLSW